MRDPLVESLLYLRLWVFGALAVTWLLVSLAVGARASAVVVALVVLAVVAL